VAGFIAALINVADAKETLEYNESQLSREQPGADLPFVILSIWN